MKLGEVGLRMGEIGLRMGMRGFEMEWDGLRSKNGLEDMIQDRRAGTNERVLTLKSIKITFQT